MKTMLATALAAAIIAAPATATAAPTKCVDYTEWRDTTRSTMRGIEAQWGVEGVGAVVHTQDHGRFVIKQYPGCNPDTFAQVLYALNDRDQYMSQYASWWNLGRKS